MLLFKPTTIEIDYAEWRSAKMFEAVGAKFNSNVYSVSGGVVQFKLSGEVQLSADEFSDLQKILDRAQQRCLKMMGEKVKEMVDSERSS